MDYIEAFNGFRGFGFLNVVLDHYTYPTGRALDFGQFGVGMFYVLSSYLLTLILYKQYLEKGTLNIINYWIRRIFRIYPMLTIALIFEYFLGRFDMKSLLGIYFLYALRGVYWTIYIEMRYYILMPLLVFVFGNIKNLYIKFSLMAGVTGIGFYYHYYLNFVQGGYGFRRWDIDDFSFEKNIVFVNYLPVFILGSFMGIIVYHLKKEKYDFNSYSIQKGIFILFMSLIHFPLIAYRSFKGNDMTFWDFPWSNFNLLFCFGYVFIFLFFNGDNFMSKFYGLKGVAFFGNISYPAYLLHQGMRDLFTVNLGWSKTFPVLSFSFLITILISYFLHITVENYFINLTKFWCYIKVEKDVPKEEKKLIDSEENKEKEGLNNSSNSRISSKDTEIVLNGDNSQDNVN